MHLIIRYLVLITLLAGCAKQRPVDISHGMVTPAWHVPDTDDVITVLTWNLEHFVDDTDNPYVNSRRENSARPDEQDRRNLFAQAMREMNPDIACFQEAESAEYIKSLADELFPDLGYLYVSSSESTTWYQNTVVLSRLPLGVQYSYASVTTPVRGSLDREGRAETQNHVNTRMSCIDVYHDTGYTFTLCNVHLKAGTKERDHSMRRGQIEFLLGQFDRMMAERPDLNIVVAGDYNSAPGYEEFELFLTPWRRVDFDDPLDGSGVLTHPSDEPERRIDHIIPNDRMMRELVPGSIRVPLLSDPSILPRTSDHLPLLAEFRARDR